MKYDSKLLVGVLFSLTFACLSAKGQGTFTYITFDFPAPQPPGTSILIQNYYEDGMHFYSKDSTGFGRHGGGQSGAPENGTTYLHAGLGSILVFNFENGSSLDPVSVDLAEYSTVFQEPATITFVGYQRGGTTVTTSFTTDGIIDGTGPLADFETFYFPPEFRNVYRVELPMWGWALDNLVVAVPEPGTGALLLVGALTFGLWQMKRRK